MRLSDLTESMIRRHFGAEILRRGDEYRQDGSVEQVVQRGDTLTGLVQGSEYDPYRVTITLGKRDVQSAACTCPYSEEWEGWCKHIAAVLLLCLHAPGMVDEAPPLETLLAPLDRDSLQSLLVRLAERNPILVDEIADAASSVRKQPTNTKQHSRGETSAAEKDTPPPPDTAAIRRRVRGVLHSLDRMRSSDAYWQVGGVAEQVRDTLQDQVRRRLESDDARGALTALEAITEQYVEGWYELDDSDGEMGAVFSDIGMLWTETILTLADKITPREQVALEKKLKAWRGEASDYGVDDDFDDALEALEQRWDDPEIQRVLRGEAVEPQRNAPVMNSRAGTVWEDKDEEEDEEAYVPYSYRSEGQSDLNDARLNVLERQGRWEEALRLARWAGKDVRAVRLLIAQQRWEEVEAYALQVIDRAEDMLTIAQALDENSPDDDAAALERTLRIAERGLDLPGAKHTLALYLRDVAAQSGDMPRARRAAEVAVREAPDLADWKRLEELTPADEWPALRTALLDEIPRSTPRQAGFVTPGAIDILLHEGLVRKALDAIRDGYSEDMAARVAEAAAPLFPNEVIPLCHRWADPVMDGGKSGHYEDAARWLARAKTAYQAAGRGEEWRRYLEHLLETHRRKYRLIPLLRELSDGRSTTRRR